MQPPNNELSCLSLFNRTRLGDVCNYAAAPEELDMQDMILWTAAADDLLSVSPVTTRPVSRN